MDKEFDQRLFSLEYFGDGPKGRWTFSNIFS